MCGIAGICNMSAPGPVSMDSIVRMMDVMRHRGPDESGVYLDDWIGLGHNRLSIIGLSSGSQPIHNEDGALWIVYNGEIFNYIELKEDLIKKGHRFYTATDTEVIVHLYEEKGPDCLHDLNGQFAFAIWNSRERELFLARDRVGIRPLHYTVQNGRLIFASEIKAIFTDAEAPRRIDPIAMDQIFTFWTTLNDRTAFEGVRELPPGHCLKLSRGQITTRQYWTIPFYPPDEQLDWPLEDICQHIRELILDSIRIRLRSDVPVGCYLSGGLDSSGITTLVKSRFNNNLKTFGIRFEETAFDEGEYQDHMLALLKTDHVELQAENGKIGALFPEVVQHCEKPVLRTAPVPLFMLSQLVHENSFKVVLTGEGADEVFGGYNIFRETKVREFWARRPESKLRPLLLGRLYPYIFKNPRLRHTLRTFFADGLEDVGGPFFSHHIRWRNTSKIKLFFSDELKAAVSGYDGCEELRCRLPEQFSEWDALSKAQYLEMSIFLSNYLLSSQGDRVAMAHSVEIRLPYLDYRIIDFLGRIPSKWKILGLNEKFILKKTFQQVLPEKIRRRPKQPYRAPVSLSLLSKDVSHAREMLSDEVIDRAGLFDKTKVKMLIKKCDAHRNLSELDNMALAGIISSHLIHDRFIDHFSNNPAGDIRPFPVFDHRTGSTAQSAAF